MKHTNNQNQNKAKSDENKVENKTDVHDLYEPSRETYEKRSTYKK